MKFEIEVEETDGLYPHETGFTLFSEELTAAVSITIPATAVLVRVKPKEKPARTFVINLRPIAEEIVALATQEGA